MVGPFQRLDSKRSVHVVHDDAPSSSLPEGEDDDVSQEVAWRETNELVAEAVASSPGEFLSRHRTLAIVCENVEGAHLSRSFAATARVCWRNAEGPGRIRVGRRPEWAAVVLAHPRVSKEHLTLASLDDSGRRWGVMDHGSSNGTTYAGTLLAPHVLTPIADGEPILLADSVQLRVFVDPLALHAAFRRAQPEPSPSARREVLLRLASTLRSLGFDADYAEDRNEVRVDPDLRVRVSGEVYVVESCRDGLFVQRATARLLGGPDPDQRLREVVLETLGFGGKGRSLFETHSD